MKHTDPLRKCNSCGLEAHTEEDLELFEKETRGKHGRRNKCKSCRRERDTYWRSKNKDKVIYKTKKYHAQNTYGISLDEYLKRMSTSDCCEVCGSKDNLSYDHDHNNPDPNTNFRGVLCNKCNRSIGQLGDTLEAVEKVISYLRRSQ